MINMKSRNGSESDVIYVCYILFLSHVCYILFSCSSFMYGSCMLYFIFLQFIYVWQLYLTFHLCQCSQMSSSESDDSSDGEFFLKWLRAVQN